MRRMTPAYSVLVFCLVSVIRGMKIVHHFTDTRDQPYFEQMTMDTRSGELFLGSVNKLYKLDSDLNFLQEYINGPREDNPDCPPWKHDLICDHTFQKKSIQNYVKGIIMNDKTDSLIVCSSTFQGACQILSTKNISHVIKNIDKPVISNNPTSPSVLFIGQGYLHKDTLYVASWYNDQFNEKSNEIQRQVPFISSRNLQNLDFSYEDNNIGTFVNVRRSKKSDLRVDLVFGFEFGGFDYFITRYNSQESRIIRLCHNDKSFSSFVEMPLKCRGSSNYSLAKGAVFEKSTGDLFVVFVKNSESSLKGLSAVCSYKMTETERMFDETVKHCHNGEGSLGPDYVKAKAKCPKSNDSIPDPLCGGIQAYSAIEGSTSNPIFQKPFLEFPDRILSSVTVLPRVTDSLIFLGTDQGHIIKVVKSGSMTSIVDQLLIQRGSSINERTPMQFSRDKEFIYLLTFDKVVKVDISHCESRTTCETCTQTEDPICGWCVMENRCTEAWKCGQSVVQPHWIAASNTAQCPSMKNLKPTELSYEHIASKQDQQEIQFKLGDVILSGGHEGLHCSFTSWSKRVKTFAQVQDDVFTCPVPGDGQLDLKPRGKDYHNVEVQLHVLGRSIVKRSVKVYDCTVNKRCSDCTSSSFDCAWYYKDHTCTSVSIVALKPSKMTGTNFSNSCPRVESPLSQNQDIIVHSGDEKQIAVKLVNMEAGQTDNMKCRFTYSGKTHIVPGTVQSTSLTCDPHKFELFDEDKSFVAASFDVLWGPNNYPLDIPKPISVRIYKCQYLVTYCGQCLTLDKQFDCGWCNSTEQCTVQKHCSNGWLDRAATCPHPKILRHSCQDAGGKFILIEPECCRRLELQKRFEPSLGPINGQTNVSVSGINLGKTYTDISGGVKVAGVNCRVLPEHFQASTGFVCLLDPVRTAKNGTIEVAVDNLYTAESDSIFSFVRPEANRIHPKKGPLSGGTRLTIIGSMMHVGTMTTVDIGGSPCKVERRNESEIVCMTSKSVSDVGVKDVEVNFGGYRRLLSQKFNYTEDPVINQIQPVKSILSGGIKISVYGQRLEFVQRVEIFLEGSKKKYVCHGITILLGYYFECYSPPVTLTNGENVTEYKPKEVHFGLDLDGVTTYRNISHQQKFRPLQYYPNPVIQHIPDDLTYQKDEELVIEGKYLVSLHSIRHSLKVIVGKRECESVKIIQTTITCKPPEDPEVTGGKAPVIVKVGFYQENIGQLTYTELADKHHHEEKPMAMGVILGVVLPIIAIIALLAFCIIRRQRKTRPPKGGIPEILKEEEKEEEEEIGMNSVSVKVDMNGPIANGDSGPYISELLARIEDEAVKQNVSDLLIPRSKLDIGELIGKGSFGNTSQGQYKSSKGADADETSVQITVKTLQGCCTDNETIDKFLQQCVVFKDLQHPNVLELTGVCLSATEPPMLVRPYLQRGDLKNYIKDTSKNVTLLELLEMAHQVCEGMSYLEGLHIVHRNLASRNCLITDGKVVMVTDYSITQLYSVEFYNMNGSSLTVTKWWAPEAIDTYVFNHKTDCWSYGIVLWELMTRGVTPYPDVETADLKKYLTGGHRLKKPRQCPESIYLLMLKCWTDVPSDRPTFQEISDEIKKFLSTEETTDVNQPLNTKVEPGGSQEYLGVMGSS